MARAFGVGPNEVSLGMTAYMLTLAVFIPVSGWIADRFGSRTVFASALCVFTVASVLCGASIGIKSFTTARVLQGMGGALMVPVGRMVVVRNTDKRRMLRAISTITWPAIIAPVIGPTLGGFITTYASWRWIFLLNVPVSVAALAAILRYVPNQHGDRPRPLDVLGFLLSAMALTGVMYGTELASHQESNPLAATGIILAALGLGSLAVRHLQRVADPLLNLRVLRIPTYAATVLWGSATRIGIEAVPYLSPLLFQIGFGLSAFQSGLRLLATASGNLGMKFFTSAILRRFGFRQIAIVASSVATVFAAGYGWLMPSTPLLLTLIVLFFYGLGRSLQFTTLATLAYADVDDGLKAAASTLWSAAQQMTIGLGIAFGALCLHLSATLRLSVAQRTSGPFALDDFRRAFVAAGAVVLLSIVGYARLPRDAGASIAGAG
jgi:EmrB/QacA subfamily drug resistance transporter